MTQINKQGLSEEQNEELFVLLRDFAHKIASQTNDWKEMHKDTNAPWEGLSPANMSTLKKYKLELSQAIVKARILAREEKRLEILDDIMAEIDGHYDNPNLASNLENYFGITFQDWEKKE